MNEETLNIIKEIITQQIIQLEEDIHILEEDAKPIAPDSAYGRITRMDAINNKVVTDAALRDKRTTLHHLKYTLSKIDSEQFGKCIKCGNDIPINRLKILPNANLCVTCPTQSD